MSNNSNIFQIERIKGARVSTIVILVSVVAWLVRIINIGSKEDREVIANIIALLGIALALFFLVMYPKYRRAMLLVVPPILIWLLVMWLLLKYHVFNKDMPHGVALIVFIGSFFVMLYAYRLLLLQFAK